MRLLRKGNSVTNFRPASPRQGRDDPRNYRLSWLVLLDAVPWLIVAAFTALVVAA